jgi:outer membrane immunogenic protein
VQTVSTELIYKFNSTNTAGADSSALAYKARPAPMPAQNWTGFYLNGGGGYGMWTADTTTVAPTTGVCVLCVTQTQGGKGYFGTVGGGYDYQFAVNLGQWNPQLVAGLFADADFADIAGTIQDQTSGLGGKLRDTRNWAVGARIGWLTTPQLLSYFNGGFTQAHFDSATMDFSPSGATTPFVTPAFTQDGWFLGGGLETSLAPLLPNGWFLRSEYRYSYFGTARLTDSAPGLGSPVLIGPPPVFALNPQNSITFHPTIQTIATALVYKF